MIAAADINGFVIEACSVVLRERGKNDRDMSRGTIGKERFKIWLKENLIPVLGFYALQQPRSLVLIGLLSLSKYPLLRSAPCKFFDRIVPMLVPLPSSLPDGSIQTYLPIMDRSIVSYILDPFLFEVDSVGPHRLIFNVSSLFSKCNFRLV